MVKRQDANVSKISGNRTVRIDHGRDPSETLMI